MTKTPNYSLNQWDAGDKILHGDFNEDNRKLDALLGEMERRVRIREATVPEDCASFDLTLDGIDLTEFDRILIQAQAASETLICMRPNGLKGMYYYATTSSSSGNVHTDYIPSGLSYENSFVEIQFMASLTGDALLYSYFGYNGSTGCGGSGYTQLLTYDQLKFVRFLALETTDRKIKAGARFRVLGVPRWK